MDGYYLELEALCEMYGWLPSQIENENAETIAILSAIARGKGERREDEIKDKKRKL